MEEKDKKTEKKLFKLWGDIRWLGRNDQRYYFSIPEEKALFRWAFWRGGAELRFKRVIQLSLKAQCPSNYPRKLSHIMLWDAHLSQQRN